MANQTEPAESPGAAAPPEGKSAADNGMVTIDGKPYPKETVKEWQAGYMKDADYRQKTSEVARMREEVEALRNEYQSRLDAIPQTPQREEAEPLQGWDPAFREEWRSLKSELSEIKSALKVTQAEAAENAEAQALANAVSQFANRPFYGDGSAIIDFMVENHLRPEQAEIAYKALYDARVGYSIGEAEALQRGAAARPLMGPTSISPGFTNPHDAPVAERPISDVSWDELGEAALQDSRRRGVKFG